ncbi:C1 family peptidase [Derxia gummosa]|uniref:C1 family peptidase n=1 Tax=Derxia gummosa DSM 723 TaxID=1121388 RepID=A0A8B6X5L2_9BURK|nr:C1 family peptidase [Derxia gummosa]
MKQIHGLKLGWQRDLPDFRDLDDSSKRIADILMKSAKLKSAKADKTLPAAIDLRQYCSPIETQGTLGACTAHAGVGLIEYFERRAFGKHMDGSRRFLYKVTRLLSGIEGDDGAQLRDTMKAMVLFGVPPEDYWPYDIKKFNAEPTAFCYSFAANFKAIEYYRLDPAGTAPKDALRNIKEKLAAELPSMFGFSVYSSIPEPGDGKGEIPFPAGNDKMMGGHAVMAVGYDDRKKIGGSKGALLIRNSWGKEWGDKGYGWLPYEYVLEGLAGDFWSLVKANFVDTDLFN